MSTISITKVIDSLDNKQLIRCLTGNTGRIKYNPEKHKSTLTNADQLAGFHYVDIEENKKDIQIFAYQLSRNISQGWGSMCGKYPDFETYLKQNRGLSINQYKNLQEATKTG